MLNAFRVVESVAYIDVVDAEVRIDASDLVRAQEFPGRWWLSYARQRGNRYVVGFWNWEPGVRKTCYLHRWLLGLGEKETHRRVVMLGDALDLRRESLAIKDVKPAEVSETILAWDHWDKLTQEQLQQRRLDLMTRELQQRTGLKEETCRLAIEHQQGGPRLMNVAWEIIERYNTKPGLWTPPQPKQIRHHWHNRLDEICGILEALDDLVVTTSLFRKLTGLAKSRSAEIFARLGATQHGRQLLMDRKLLIERLRAYQQDPLVSFERVRSRKVWERIDEAKRAFAGRRVTLPAIAPGREENWQELPDGIRIARGKIEIAGGDAGEIAAKMLAVAQSMLCDYDSYEQALGATQQRLPLFASDEIVGEEIAAEGQ